MQTKTKRYSGCCPDEYPSWSYGFTADIDQGKEQESIDMARL
jgi:hypothetical protein